MWGPNFEPARAKSQKIGAMEAPGRVELPTRSLGNCCSIHLSYGARIPVYQ